MKIQINLDCRDADAMVAFYTEALGYELRGSAAQYRAMLPKEGSGPKFVLQQVPEAKEVKNRMHLDFIVDDIEAEATRYEQLGATRVSAAPVEEFGVRWIVMRDPEGNELCLCDG